jgi:ThiF family protein/JAB domain-containing protein similar to deubiquitination enzymes
VRRAGLSLVIPGRTHRRLRAHLFPGDGLEAAALLLCSRVDLRRSKLIVRDVLPVPHEACARRTRDALTWPGEYVENAIDLADAEGLTVMAVHSHPGGLFAFSAQDDASDRILMPALFHGTGRDAGSAVMVPDGRVCGRMYDARGNSTPTDVVMCAGDDIDLWWSAADGATPVAFTAGMTEWLGRLSACVIGVSGTGSIVAEQLARLGFGEIILIDFDKVEERNLNRILNSTVADAEAQALKVKMFARAIRRYRADCHVIPVAQSIATREAVLAACEADVLFSCVDTAEGRHIADRVAAFFAMPLFDVGVAIPTRAAGSGRAIAEVCGRIDYVQPGGASLADRGVYSPATLEAEYLAKAAPEAHRQRVAEGYLRGMPEQAPAVIALNMRAASACVMELIARAFPFRHAPNGRYARTTFMLADGDEDHASEESFARSDSLSLGTGLQEPLLGLPALTAPRTRP